MSYAPWNDPMKEEDMTPYNLVLKALRTAEKSKTTLIKETGVPYGPIGHTLEVLVLEGKVRRASLRFRITPLGEKYLRDHKL